MNRTVSQCPQQHTHAHTPSPPVSINPRTTNKRNPDAAALSGPRMADTMASDTEPSALPNAEQSAVVSEAEVSSPTPRSPSRTSPSSCENSAPSDPSTRTTSTETTNKPQPPTKTVESVRRRPLKISRTSWKKKSQRVSQLPPRRPPLPPNPRRRGALWLATLTRGASVDWRKRRHLLCRRRVAPTGRL